MFLLNKNMSNLKIELDSVFHFEKLQQYFLILFYYLSLINITNNK